MTLCLHSYGTGFSSCSNFENTEPECFLGEQELERNKIDKEVRNSEKCACVDLLKYACNLE